MLSSPVDSVPATPAGISRRVISRPVVPSTSRTESGPAIPPRSTRTSTGTRSRTNARAGTAVETIAASPIRSFDPSATVNTGIESRSNTRSASPETGIADRPSESTNTPLTGRPAARPSACRSALSRSVRSPFGVPTSGSTASPLRVSENAPPANPT